MEWVAWFYTTSIMSLRKFGYGNGKPKRTALIQLTADPNLALVKFNQHFGDRQPKACSGLLSDVRMIGPKEARKKLALIAFRNTNALILNLATNVSFPSEG